MVVALAALFIALSGVGYAATLAPNSVGAKQLKKSSVTAAKISASAVTSPKIAAGAVNESKLVNGAVTAAKLADGAVSNTRLADGAVTASKLASGAVGSSALASGAVTTPAIGANQVTGAQVNEASLSTVPTASVADSATTAGNATQLGGIAATQYRTGEFVVFPAVVGNVVTRSSGGVTVARIAAGIFTVAFTRDVSNCAYLASFGDVANGDALTAHFVHVEGAPTPALNDVNVRVFNTAGTQADASAPTDGVHLSAIC
jgi:trimeric autotransporter adhesin